VILKRFYDDSLAHASYLVGCPGAGEAVVIDPNRAVDQYIDAAADEGLVITTVAETHIHADYVSGTRELSELTGATMILSGEGGSDWQYALPDMSRARLVRDGDTFWIGAVRFDVLHTPGHTPEHIAFLLTDEAVSPEPQAVFTGDFVFVGDVGRPDLLENAAGVVGTMEPGARDLYRSIQRFKAVPPFVALWPAHGAGSACGKSLGGVPVSTVGYESLTNWAFKAAREDSFVAEVLSGQPEPPPYFARMKVINRVGPEPIHGRRVAHAGTDEVKSALILDVRSSDEYLGSHPRGALHIPLGRSFLRWAGWLLEPADRIVIAAHDEGEANAAALKLSLIGIDAVVGWIEPSEVENEVSRTGQSESLAGSVVVDVRTASEWADGHLDEALHVPLHRLPGVVSDIPGGCIAVHCHSGARSPIATSILERAGRQDVICVTIGYPELTAAVLQTR
jgi:hydroxyacylglutathione hydrolase